LAEESAAILSKLTTEPFSCSDVAQNSCNHVYISREGIFKQVLQDLDLEVHEVRSCAVGNGQMVGSVCIDVPAHEQHLTLYRQLFFGDYALTERGALESAKLAVLVYLQKTVIILVDDVNLAELFKCQSELQNSQHKLLAVSSWVNLFQERAESLQNELAIAHAQIKSLLGKAKMFHTKEETKDPGLTDHKTNEVPLVAPGIEEDTSAPPQAKGQPSNRGSRGLGVATARRTLFKK